ncbi:MAG: hypothetical protein COB17_06085 [Sulfurimonas sp.]|nr:MAG: hypothetical protein COB17_06085 [Sulfurimonas sp.]
MREPKINKSRALYYAMFSRFFIYTSDNSRYFELVNLLNILKDNPLDNSMKTAFENILKSIDPTSNINFMLEFDEIFHSPESSTVPTTASFYDENIQSGKKRVQMQNFLAKTKIRRDEKIYSDYEDHIGFIFSVLSELCSLISEGEKQYENTVHCIFEQILNEFIDEFSKELYEHDKADIFKNAIVILKSFIEFERLYLEVSMPAPRVKIQEVEIIEDDISDDEKERRARNRALRATGAKTESCSIHIAYEVEDDI